MSREPWSFTTDAIREYADKHEGPLTPLQMERVFTAMLWDGQVVRAAALANTMRERVSDDTFGYWLGAADVLNNQLAIASVRGTR